MTMEEKLKIQYGDYEAVLYPEAGGALVTLRKGDTQVFWPCKNAQEAMEAPTRHGLPCLFPPNRIDAGHFVFDGREYQFPMRPNKANNFSHGFLHIRPWKTEKLTENTAVLRYDCDETTDFYPAYPHRFRMEVRYTLTEAGLSQEAQVTNFGSTAMPVGLGWHTAFLLPFAPDSTAENVRCRISLGQRILLNERMLPTGELRALSEEEQKFREAEGQSPLYAPMDDHFTAEPILVDGKPFHGAVLEDRQAGTQILYEVDAAYKHWMIFNARAAGNLICIEPQNWRINAPNLGIPYEEAGLDVLRPGESKCYKARIEVRRIPE